MITLSNGYVLDTNSFINPYRDYYSFDFGMSFWDQLEIELRKSNIILLDVVRNEILKHSDDELSKWIKNIKSVDIKRVKKESIIINYYGEVLNYIQTCGYYDMNALLNWADPTIADAWIIAAAAAYEFDIVTFEIKASRLSKLPKHQQKNAKIPDVARHFNVKCKSLFDFMRDMNFQL